MAYIIGLAASSIPTISFLAALSIFRHRPTYPYQQITMMIWIIPIIHLVLLIPGTVLIHRYGIIITSYAGAVLVIIGVWLRVFIQEADFSIAVLGSVLGAMGIFFIVIIAPELANAWLRQRAVPYAIYFSTMTVSMMSMMIGFGLISLFVNSPIGQHSELSFKDFTDAIRDQAIMVSVFMVVFVLGIRVRPNMPVSRVAEFQLIFSPKLPYLQSLKALFTSRNYVLLFIAAICTQGSFFYLAFYYAMQDWLKFTLAAIIAGGVSNTIIGIASYAPALIRNLKLMTLILILGSLLSVVILWATDGGSTPNGVWGGLFGVFTLPAFSSLFLFSSEVTYPLDQSLSYSFLVVFGEIFGFLPLMFTTNIFNFDGGFTGGAPNICIGYLILALIALIFTTPDYRKRIRQRLESEAFMIRQPIYQTNPLYQDNPASF